MAIAKKTASRRPSVSSFSALPRTPVLVQAEEEEALAVVRDIKRRVDKELQRLGSDGPRARRWYGRAPGMRRLSFVNLIGLRNSLEAQLAIHDLEGLK